MEAILVREEGRIRDAIKALEGQATAVGAVEELKQAACTARGRVFLLANGGIRALVQAIKASTTRSDDGPGVGTVDFLTVLQGCCYDPECAVELGAIGAHGLMGGLMLSEDEGVQEVMVDWYKGGGYGRVDRHLSGNQGDLCLSLPLEQAASEVVMRCSSFPGGFSARKAAWHEEDMVAGLPWRITIGGVATAPGDPAEEVVLLLRQVGERMSCQADTGFKLWPAATILARFLATNSHLLHGKVVLELGAGLGLCGVLAGHFAKEVIITDYNHMCLSRLRDNIELNRGLSLQGSALSQEAGRMMARWLDWDMVESVSEGEGGCKIGVAEDGGSTSSPRGMCEPDAIMTEFEWVCPPLDVVIGSDVICEEANAKGIARFLDIALKPGGIALITMPFPDHRYGVDSFPRHLADRGLHFQAQEVTDPRLLQGLDEASFMKFQLYHITKPGSKNREARNP